MLNKLKNIRWFYFSLFMALLTLIAVLFLQHIMGIAPCDLCYKQRYIWYAITFVSLAACFYEHNILFFITLILFMTSMGYAFYHSGIIYELWLGPTSCSNEQVTPFDLQTLDFSSISDLNYNPLCSSEDQKILTIPLAVGNFLISVFGFFGTIVFYRFSSHSLQT